MYRLVMISINLSETAQKSALEIRDNVRDKIQSEKKSKIFLSTKFFSTIFQIMSQTGFCLGLHTAIVFRVQSFNYNSVPRALKVNYVYLLRLRIEYGYFSIS